MDIVNLGKLKFGKPHQFTISFKNETDKEIHLKRLNVGCTSCTKASINKEYLKPDEVAIIDVVFTPGSLGPQTKGISLSYDETSVKFEFTSDVEN